MKILILMAIIIGCHILCLFISYAIGRTGWVKPYTGRAIFPIIFLAFIFCIPVLMYLPYMPVIPEEEMKDALPWILLGGISLNAWGVMQGIFVGYKKRLTKGLTK